MADLFTVPPLPQTSYSVDLYNAYNIVLRKVVSLVWPFDSVKPFPVKNSIVRAPRYIRESSIGSRESLPLQYGHLCINWFQRCQFTQSLPLNRDNAVTRAPASVPVVSSVTNYDQIVSPQTG